MRKNGTELGGINNCSATMAITYSTYRLGAVASLTFLAIEIIPQHFLAHVYYGQTARWIRIPLGTEVCLGPGNIVLDGDPAPKEKGTATPSYRPTALAGIPQTHTLLITRIVDYAVRGGRLSWQSYRIIATRLVCSLVSWLVSQTVQHVVDKISLNF